MNAFKRVENIGMAVRAERELPAVMEAGTVVALEQLPARFVETLPAVCVLETIAGRVYVRSPSIDP